MAAKSAVGEGQTSEWKGAFMAVDSDEDGFLTITEMCEAIKQLGYTCSKEEIMNKLSVDVESTISFEDFEAYISANLKGEVPEADPGVEDSGSVSLVDYLSAQEHSVMLKALASQFKEMDLDNDGLITAEDWVKEENPSGKKISLEEATVVIAQMDKRGKGGLNFEAYAKLMHLELEKLSLLNELVSLYDQYGHNEAAREEAFVLNAKLDYEGLKSFFEQRGISMSNELFSLIFALADRDGDGKLTFSEFTQMISGFESPTLY